MESIVVGNVPVKLIAVRNVPVKLIAVGNVPVKLIAVGNNIFSLFTSWRSGKIFQHCFMED